MYQRSFLIGLTAVGALLVIILGVGALYQYRIFPNQVLATVNGQEITRQDYWRYQNVVLYQQARQYDDFALQVQGDQQTQFLSYAQQLDAARATVWGSSDVSDTTITQMVDDQLYVAAAESRGVDLSQERLLTYALNGFAPEDHPLVQPIATPTLIPARAAWATGTAESIETTATAQATMVVPPLATPGATPVATPIAAAASPAVSDETVRNDAMTEWESFQTEVLPLADLSPDEYLDLFIKPQVARDEINAQLVNDVAQSGPQANVDHIMVRTEDLANQVEARLKHGEKFSDLAEELSIDTATAGQGGQLGWVTQGELPEALDAAAFRMEPGSISAPIETPVGWHILRLNDRQDDRPLTTNQYTSATSSVEATWLAQQREALGVDSAYYAVTPTPTATAFVPPADAPQVIPATPVPARDLSATPIQGPVLPAVPASSPPVSTPATPVT